MRAATETADSVSSVDCVVAAEHSCTKERRARYDTKEYCRSKCVEWSTKGFYPKEHKIALLRLNPLLLSRPQQHYYSFDVGTPCGAQFEDILRQLGWVSVDSGDSKALSRLDSSSDAVLLIGPEAVTAMRPRVDYNRYAKCLAYWEQRLQCLDSYWHLYDTLHGYEQTLELFTQMGLLGEPVDDSGCGCGRQLTCDDFMLPTVYLGEVWGKRLSIFLKAHGDYFRVKSASGSGPAAAGFVFKPLDSDKSGRKRMDNFQEMLKKYRSAFPTNGLENWILQAYPEAQMLVIGRQVSLETYLLVAPRRKASEGLAAFFHQGLVRMRSADGQAELSHTFTWIPDQLSDYLSASSSQQDWLMGTVYPRIEAVCAYLVTALAQQLRDSNHSRYHLLRLSFTIDSSQRPRLTDVSQQVVWPVKPDFCESLVLPRLLQEAILIVSELLVKSTHTTGLLARELTSPHNMKLVWDSADPSVQRSVMSGFRRDDIVASTATVVEC